MKLPRFVLGMLTALLVFAIVTFALTGAFWTTILQTLLCGILIQVGYFLVVVFLVSRTRTSNQLDERQDIEGTSAQSESKGSADTGKIGVLQSLRRLGTLK